MATGLNAQPTNTVILKFFSEFYYAEVLYKPI